MGPLITATALAEALGAGPGRTIVLDVRYRTGGGSGVEEYATGHVPGAAYVDLDAGLAAPPSRDGGRHPLPEGGAFGAAMRRVGVRRDRPVVVYDDWGGRAAARAWWLLRFHGHRDVRVLDGGLACWVAGGGALETTHLDVTAGDFEPEPGHLRVVDADQVPEVTVLVDARAPERYRGDVEPIDAVAGHIPGAVNVPTERNLAADGRFHSSGDLAEIYAAVGATAGADVAAYCGSGVTAAHDVLALAIAGVDAALYPGSWSGWITDPDRPVVTPACRHRT